MPQAAAERICVVPQRIVCKGDQDVRMLASEYRGSATSVIVVPSKSSVTIVTTTTAVVFECDQAVGNRSLMIANILVGAGRFCNTSSVPEHLTDPSSKDGEQYIA